MKSGLNWLSYYFPVQGKSSTARVAFVLKIHSNLTETLKTVATKDWELQI